MVSQSAALLNLNLKAGPPCRQSRLQYLDDIKWYLFTLPWYTAVGAGFAIWTLKEVSLLGG
jgi:hypothetical protein